MKYIRTKDGIYEVKKVEILCGVKFYDYETREDFVNRNREEHIIKQADTIEELCDEIVIRHITSSKPYIADEYQKTQILKDRQKAFVEYGVEEVRCAIWTDKGLIYVAKMVDGDLELI